MIRKMSCTLALLIPCAPTSRTSNFTCSPAPDLYSRREKFKTLRFHFSTHETKFADERVCTHYGSCKLKILAYELDEEGGRRQRVSIAEMKERAQELQSIMRRRCSKDEIAMEVAEYLRSRKMAIKVVSRALKDLKKVEINYAVESNEITDAISRLRECQMVTLSMLESVLVAIAGAKARSSWDSVVSKLLKSKRVASQQEAGFFLVEFEAADASLHPEQVRSELEKMEISIKNVEEGVEILFRHLIKTRTTILNILNC